MAQSETDRGAGTGRDTNSTDQLIDEHQTARMLGLSVKTLRRWRWAGRPPRFLKIGSAVRYDPAELASFIEAARRTSTTDTGSSG